MGTSDIPPCAQWSGIIIYAERTAQHLQGQVSCAWLPFSTGSGAYFARYLNSVVHPPVLIVEIDMFREALRNLVDLINFHKRRLCVDAVVVPSRDYSEIAIPFSHLTSLLVEQCAGIDPGMGCGVVTVGLCVCPET
jgi:hypothetical protein